MKINSFLGLVFMVGILQAQLNKNIFLERSFWKSAPTLDIVKQKVKEGNDPSEFNKHSFDAISYALLEKSDVVGNEIIKYLLTQKGNEINKITHDGRTYIFWAAYSNRLKLIKYLISEGAKTDVIDSHGYSLLNFTAVSGIKNTVLYDYLISQGADVNKEKSLKGANALLLLIPSLENFTMVNYFISKGININDTDDNGNGAINYAAKKGNKKMIKLFIEKGLPYKNLNRNGGNAFLLATKGSRKGYNSLVFFKYLENLGIKPNVTNKQGITPLHNLAYRNKDVSTLKYFIDKGVNIDKQTIEGNTILMNAASKNTLEVVKLFKSKTKNLNLKNKKGHSVLTNAIRNKPEVLAYLLKDKVDISVVDVKGNNLSYYLMQTYNSKKENEFLSKINLLEEKGFKITKPQKDGNTLFHLAANEGNLSLLKFLSKFDININAKNKEGETALQKAVMVAKNSAILKFLLKKGADKTVTTSFNETVYDLAIENEQLSKLDLNFLK